MQSCELYNRSNGAAGAPPVQGAKRQRWLCRSTLLMVAGYLAAGAAVQALGQAQAPGADPVAHETASSGSSGPTAAAPAGTPAVPASPADAGSKNNIRVNVQVVNVPVTVLDKRGTPVIDLSQKDFRIYENGQLQTIKYFVQQPAPPLRIGLIIDTSNSARPLLSYEKDAASEFVFDMLQGRTTKNQVFLETFDATSSVVHDFTSDPDELNDTIRDLKAGGGKALYDAIFTACHDKMMHAGLPEQMRRVLVVMSDGLDVQSTHTFEEVVSMAHLAETSIYTIHNSPYGFTADANRVLKDLAAETGGAYFFPQQAPSGTDLGSGYLAHGQIGCTSQNEGLGAKTGIYTAERLEHLADSVEAIGQELNDQYFIGYSPANQTLDGTYRVIRVVALRNDVRVRAKPGYWALPE
jgi:Ca-activated chloride channel homolog